MRRAVRAIRILRAQRAFFATARPLNLIVRARERRILVLKMSHCDVRRKREYLLRSSPEGARGRKEVVATADSRARQDDSWKVSAADQAPGPSSFGMRARFHVAASPSKLRHQGRARTLGLRGEL